MPADGYYLCLNLKRMVWNLFLDSVSQSVLNSYDWISDWHSGFSWGSSDTEIAVAIAQEHGFQLDKTSTWPKLPR